MPALRVDPLFALLVADAYTDRHIAALAAGTAAAVHIPGFLDEPTCAVTIKSTNRLPIDDYDPTRVPVRIARFGPALNDYRGSDGALHERYWQAANAARIAWTAARLRPDPVAIALARLGAAWGSAIAPATISGRPVFGGTLREINNGAFVHFDEVVREYPDGLFDQQVIAQLAFNLWIAAPESGGETTMWRRRWRPDDETHRTGYGYTPSTVRGCQHISLRSSAGDALLFNSANLHAVAPNPGQRRVAFAFFLGLTVTGTLIFWS